MPAVPPSKITSRLTSTDTEMNDGILIAPPPPDKTSHLKEQAAKHIPDDESVIVPPPACPAVPINQSRKRKIDDVETMTTTTMTLNVESSASKKLRLADRQVYRPPKAAKSEEKLARKQRKEERRRKKEAKRLKREVSPSKEKKVSAWLEHQERKKQRTSNKENKQISMKKLLKNAEFMSLKGGDFGEVKPQWDAVADKETVSMDELTKMEKSKDRKKFLLGKLDAVMGNRQQVSYDDVAC